MMLRTALSILLLFLYSGLCLKAQGSMAFEVLGGSEGLSSNTIYDIAEDELGFLWMGTKSGLFRFDGYDFDAVAISTSTSQGDATTAVLSLEVDKRGILWIGLKAGGLIAYDRLDHTFRQFPFDDNKTVDWSTITIKSIYQDSRGWLWIGTFGGGAIVLDIDRRVLAHYCTYCNEDRQEKLSNDFVFDFAEDDKGNVYIATAGRGLNRYVQGMPGVEEVHATVAQDLNSFGKTLCFDNNGTLWIGTEGNGLYAYDLDRDVWETYLAREGLLSNDIITDIKQDRSGLLWIATDGGGLNVYDPVSEVFTAIQYDPLRPNSLTTDAIYDLHFDRGGNLWIGTFNGGVNSLKAIQSPFWTVREYDMERRNGLRSVLAIQEDLRKRVWLGTDGGGLFYFNIDDSPLALHRVTDVIDGNDFTDVVTCILPDEDRGIWFGSFASGLNYYDFGAGQIRQYLHDENVATSLSHNNVWDIEMDKTGGLWIATLGGGLDYLPAGASSFKHYPTLLPSVQIIDVTIDRSHRYLWAATEAEGLYRITLNSLEVEVYRMDGPPDNRLRSDILLSTFEDDRGDLWVVHAVGLDRIDAGTGAVEHMDFDQVLPMSSLRTVTQDLDGYLWLATADGVLRLDLDSGDLLDFGIDPALSHNSYNPRSVCRLSDGRIVFGGVQSFSIVQPSAVELNDNEAVPVLTDLTLSGQSVTVGKYGDRTVMVSDLNAEDAEVHLSYEDRSITFEFSTTDYTAPSRNGFAYMLEGFDQDWHYTDATSRRITYSSLKGGRYLFKLKAANSSGVWSEHIRTLKVFIKPPFWQTGLFIGLMALLGLLGIYLIYNFLLRRQKEKYREQALLQEKELLKREQQILQLTNTSLEKEVSLKKAELNASVLQAAHKNEFLNVLKNRIKKIKADADETAAKPLRSVINIINNELKQEDYWARFQINFDQTFQNFIEFIAAKHPNLTSNDHRLCCFIKMKLNNREIAAILNITVSAVEQAKYRLKKKIGLEKAESLTRYLQQYQQ